MASKDKVAPTLAVTTPKKGGDAVAVNQNLVLIFNENIQIGTGNIVISNGKGDEQTISMISSPSQYAIIGKTLVINPARDLLSNTHYSVKIDSNAIADLSGNKYAGIDNATTLSFDTVDTLSPFLLSSSSTIKQNGIAPSDNITLTFSEKIQAGRGNITLVAGNDTRTIPISDKQITISGNTLIFNPSADFNVNSSYVLHLDAGAINDVALKPNAISAIDLNFKTLVNGDKQAPVLQKYSGKGEVSDNLQLVFQEPIKIGKGNFTLNDGTTQIVIPASDAKQVSIQNNVLTINPTQNLNPEKMYTLISPKGILTDIVGNAFAGLSAKNAFTFDTHDKTSPTLTITDDKGALTNSSILYTFTLSEPSKTFNVDSISVIGAQKGVFTSINPTKYTLNVLPNANSIASVTVEVASGAFTDFAGNGNIASEKASQAVDTLAPTLLNTSPVNQSIDVAKNSNISLFFNENISAGSGNFILSNGVDSQTISVKDATQVFINNKVLTLNPTKDLVENTEYNLTFSEGVILDKSGNAFAGFPLPTQFTLKTQPPATTTKDTAGQTQTFVDKLNAKALDGYLKGATVFADKNGNGIQDPGEASAITDEYGNFELTDPEGSLVLSGGTDLSTGKPFSGTLRAPEGSSVVTPLTTVQQGFIDAGQSPAQAEKSVAKAFGFDSEKLDLTTYDPIAEIVKTGTSSETQTIAAQIMASSAQIANFLVTTSQVLQGAAGGGDNLSQVNASNALIKSLVTAISKDESTGDGKIDLADAALLNTVIVDGAKEVQKSASSADVPNFDAENFIAKMDKISATLTEVLKSAADNISAAVANSKDGNGLALLGNLDKVSSFVQNNAGQSLQDVAVKFDIKNPNAIDVALRAQKDAFTGVAATKAIQDVVVDTQKSVGEVIAADATAKKAIEDARIAAEKAAIEKAAAEQKAIEDARIAAKKAAIEKAAAEQKAIEDARIAAEKVAKEQKALEDIARQKAINDENARLQAIEDARDKTLPTIKINSTLDTNTGLSSTINNNDITKDNTIGLGGYVSDDVSVSSVQIYDGTTALVGGAIIVNGSWTYTTPVLSDGQHNFKAIAVDSSGNSNFSNSISLTVDTLAPNAPSISVTRNISDGINAMEALQGILITVSLVNTGAVSGDTVNVSVDGVKTSFPLQTADITAGVANVTIPSTLITSAGQGDAIITATLTDVAGNVSLSSSTAVINIDTISPTPLLLTFNDTGISQSDQITKDGVVTVSGIESGARLECSFDSGTHWQTFTGTNLNLSPAFYAVDAVQVRQTDTVGNVSEVTKLPALQVDTEAPAKPSTTTITQPNTYSNSPAIQIAKALNDAVKVYVNNILTPATYSSTDGTLTFESPLKDGDNNITYTLTDAAGNESVSSDPMRIHVIHKVTIDNVSSANQPLFISGRAEANANVRLTLNSNMTVNVNADHNGNWTYDGSVRYIMIRKTLQPLTDGNSAFDANGIFTIGDISIYDKFGILVPTSNILVSSSIGFTGDWDPTKATGSLLDGNHIKSTSFSEAWGKDINATTGGEAWVQFDLGSSYPISKITVFARDAFGARLNNAQIFTSVSDMSSKTTDELKADLSINVINPINNLVNYPYNTIPMPEVKVDFQFSIQTITATETVSSLSNSTNATVINGTSSADSISGASGADFIFGGQGNDLINGGDGVDNIQGGEGSDSINGGSGDDFITGGQGSDTIDGGADYDMISYRHFDYQNQSRPPNVVVDVNLSTGIATDNWGNTDTLLSIEAVEGSDFNDSIVGSTGNEFLFGSQGNDTITGSGGSDHLQGGEGSDSITGGSGDDFISGDQGNDILIGGGGSDHIHGGEGSDSITGGSGDDFISGDQGNDILIGGGGSDHIQGGEGSDLITAVGAGDNFLSGDQGNDSINGGDGSDLISGGSGDDFISGGSGIDTLTGGDGNDTFMFNLGSQSISSSTVTDVISDFVSKSDKIDFGIASSGIQFVSQTSVVSNLATLLTAVNGINNTYPNKTDQKILFYFGVIDRDGNAGTANDRDGYLVTEDDAGVISNIIQFSGVTSLDSTDIVEL